MPSTDRENLTRLTEMFNAVKARSWPLIGRWYTGSSDDARWVEYDADDPRRGQRLPPPNPDDLSTFDSLFSTIHGELDIVPLISGTYDDLADRATTLTVHDVENVSVMSIEDLLAHLTVPRRKEDVERVAVLCSRQREARRS